MKRVVACIGFMLLLACGGESTTPSISDIEPAVATTLVETPALVRGAALFNQITVDLGSQKQASVVSDWRVRVGAVELAPGVIQRVDDRSIAIVIPAGLEVGVHDVELTSPAGHVTVLPDGLTIVAGPLGLPVTIEDAPSGNGSLVGPRSFIAGESATLYAVARDSNGAFVADVEAAWAVEGAIGSIAETSPSSLVTFQAERLGLGRVTAAPLDVIDVVSTGDFDVAAGDVAEILVRDQPGNGGAEVGDRPSNTADDSLEVFAAGYDAFGNYAGDVDATWSVTGGIGVAPAGPAPSTVIDFTRPGLGALVASDGALTGRTGDLVVAPGRAATLAQQSTPLSISADATPVTLLVTGQDADGNDTSDLGTLAWTVEAGPISVVDATSGELDPTAAGVGTVRVTSSYGPSDDGSVTISPGQAAALAVSPMTVAVSADAIAPAVDFDVTGTDSDGNPTLDLGTISWSIATGPITAIDSISGELDAITAGLGSVRATSSHGVSGDSGVVEITPGVAATITVAPETLTAIENGPGTTFTASGVDGDGNPTSDLGTLTWSIASGPITAIAADGGFAPLTPGVGTIRATSSHGPSDDSGNVTVLEEAELVVTFTSVPVQVNTGQSFTVIMRVDNVGESDASGVAPSALTQSGTTTAALISGPTPPSASISAGGFAQYSWTYAASAAGAVDFTGSASGTDVNTGNPITSAAETSSSVTVQVPAALVASVSIPPTIGLGSTFDVDVRIDNTGGASATGVAPSITGEAGTGTVTLVSGPTPASAAISGGGFQVFKFAYTADATGTIQLTADGAGVDGNDGSPVTAAEATSNTGDIVGEALLVSADPFGDGTSFTHVFGYDDKVFLAPSADGTGAVGFADGGAGSAEPYGFSFFRDTGDTATHNNSSSSPYPSIGSTGCTPDTSSCGPNNEDGRGFFHAVTVLGTEWLVGGGAHSGGDLDHVYMSTDTDATLDFSFVDLSQRLNGSTHGFSAVHAFNNRVYLGFPCDDGSRPFLLSLFTTPSQPGLNADDGTDFLDLRVDDLNNFQDSDPAMVDSISDRNNRLYIANAGAWYRSTVATPTDTADFTDVTPSAGAYGAKVSVTTSKMSDLEPADRAVPAMVEFGGNYFWARNTTAGPQLWFCSTSNCDSGSWQLIAANSAGDTQLSQFNNPNNATIGLLAATSTHLYIGFDNADGIILFRTTLASPTSRSDWTGLGGCDAGNHPTTCDSFGSAVIPRSNTRIFDGEVITSGGSTDVFIVAGNGATAVEVYRLLD